MEGPRAPTTNEYTDIVKFLNENLRENTEWSVTEEYPTVFNLANLHNFRIIKDKESSEILSHAVIKPIIVKTRRGIFKVGCLGSVVTNEKHRNQGLSQNVIKDCLEEIKNQNCDFAILWTNLFDFYRKMGFELAGTEVSFLIDRPLLVPKINAEHPSLRIIQDNKVDPAALYRVYSQHSVTSVRSLDDFDKFLKIPNSRLYTAWSTTGKLEAYAVEGKGADLQGYIHEWGGSVDAMTSLLSHIRGVNDKAVTLICPTHAQGLVRHLESLGVKRVDGYLGMIKIVNREALFNKIIKNAKLEWGIESFNLEYREGWYYYGVGKNQFKTDHEGDIVKLIFGPMKPSKLVDHGKETNEILDKIFPFEMWIWGWDSI